MTTAAVSKEDLLDLSPGEIRALTRERRWTGGTEGLARGYAQANLVIVRGRRRSTFYSSASGTPSPAPSSKSPIRDLPSSAKWPGTPT